MFSISKKSSYHQHYHPEESQGICVVRREGEFNEELFKRFRKKFSKSGLAKELREKCFIKNQVLRDVRKEFKR